MKLIRIFLFVSLVLTSLLYTSAQASPAGSALLLDTATPTPAPELLAPAQGSTPELIRPVFDWVNMPGATSYNIVISSYPSFIYPIVDLTPAASTYTALEDLPRDVTLYWRVRMISPTFGPWISSYFTSPNPPYSPAPLTPGLNAIVTDYTPTLTWAASIIPDGTTLAFYKLQVDNNQDFSSPMVDNSGLDPAYTFPSDLTPNSSYYWRVRAANMLGQYSMWRTSSFNTALLPPTLISPASMEVPNSLRPTLDWSDVPGATGYGVEVSVHPDFSSPLVSLAVATSTYTPSADLPGSTLLYWRVRTHGANISDWSSSSFTTPGQSLIVTLTATITPTRTPAGATWTPTITLSPTITLTPSRTRTPTITLTRTISPTATKLLTGTKTRTPTRTRTPTPKVILLAPAAGSVPNIIRPVFDWGDVPGATSYNIVVSSYPSFIYPIIDLTPSTSMYTPTMDLPRNIVLYWRVRVISPYFSVWTSSSFRTPNPPYSPAPLSPGLNALVTDYNPTLTWAASIIPNGTTFAFYQLQVDDTKDFSSLILNRKETNSLNRAYMFPNNLLPNSSYYWRIRTANTLGQYSMWRMSSFRTALLPPVLLSPAFQSVTSSLRPTLDWSDVPGASGYGLVVSTHSDFSSPLVNLAVTASTYLPTADLPPNTLIYWRVRTQGTNISAWSSSSFTSLNLAPATATPSRTPTATINPLGQLYQSLAYGFKFSYLNDATLVSDSGTDIRINLTFVPGTNLGEKYMETRVGDATAGPCQSSEPGKTSSFTEVINGISFLHEEGQDQAAGNIYDWVSYSTVRGSVCVNMLFVLHSGNPANYFPTPPPLFDKAAESQVFGQIVRTFAWLAPTATPTPTLTPTATP